MSYYREKKIILKAEKRLTCIACTKTDHMTNPITRFTIHKW